MAGTPADGRLHLGVRCWDGAGRPADRPFTISHTRGGTHQGSLITALMPDGAFLPLKQKVALRGETSINTSTPSTTNSGVTVIRTGVRDYTFQMFAGADPGCTGPADDDETDVAAPPDTTPPDTSITDAPQNGPSTTVSFAFTGSEAGSTFECRVDLQATGWEACTSPKLYLDLGRESHTFQVRATDAAGNTDPTPASHSWTVTDPPPPPPPPSGWPSAATTGVPQGWQPQQTRSTTLVVTQPGTVVEDVLFTGNAGLDIRANNVTVRRVKFQGAGKILGDNGTNPDCSNGAVIEDVLFDYGPGYDRSGAPVIQWIGATVRRARITNGRSEGIFVGGKDQGCGPMVIEDSIIEIDDNRDCVLHADGIQGYDGAAVTVRNVVSDSANATCGTAPFFYPRNQGNTRADVDRLMVIGGGYSFRLGMPGNVRNLKIVDEPAGPYGSGHSWAYGPLDVNCPAMEVWDAESSGSRRTPTSARTRPTRSIR